MIDWIENYIIDCNNNEERQGLPSISPSERIMTSRMSAARKRRAARLLKDRKQLNIGSSNRSKLVEIQIHPPLAYPIIPAALGPPPQILGFIAQFSSLLYSHMAGLAFHSALLIHSHLIDILSYDQQAFMLDLHDGNHLANVLGGRRRLA